MIITRIQRFSLHDGPGIRTTVFLKGCSLHCPWCCNPENINPSPQKYIKDGIEGIFGRNYSDEELAEELLKDKAFYGGKIEDPTQFNISSMEQLEKLPGGITFSGGEPLLQMKNLVHTCEVLKAQNIHIAIETSLYGNKKSLDLALDFIDLFYVDFKILNKKKCCDIIGGDAGQFRYNLSKLVKSRKPIVVRVPVIGDYTDSDENRKCVSDLIKDVEISKANILKIELLKEHNLGHYKYESLKAADETIKIPVNKGVSNEFMERYKAELEAITKIPVEVHCI